MTWSGSTRLRAGYAMGRFMPFATLGVAYGHFNVHEIYNVGGDLRLDYGSGTRAGLAAGAGMNIAVTDNIIVGGEYRYTDFARATVAASTMEAYYTWQTHDLRFGIAYKF
jgi:outer membrane immunogenic protein